MAFHCCTPEWGRYGYNDIGNMCGYCGFKLCGWSWMQSGKEDTGRMDSVIMAVVGGALGALGMGTIPDFPATDYITAVAVGAVSGLAATGVNQMYKQMNK